MYIKGISSPIIFLFSESSFRISQIGKKKNFPDESKRNQEVKNFQFFFFFFSAPWHMELLSQGSDWSCSCELSRNCSNTGFLTHCAGLGITPKSQHSQDTADPVMPQWELPKTLSIFNVWLLTKRIHILKYQSTVAWKPHTLFLPFFFKKKSSFHLLYLLVR